MFNSEIQNYQETLVKARIVEVASSYPKWLQSEDSLTDAACLALNTLPPRYVRHRLDLAFHLTPSDQADAEAQVIAAVKSAFDFLSSRRRANSRKR